MTKSRFILHYLLLNKYAYLFAIFCILIVNWLQVEIPRYIQQAIDLFGDQSEASRQELFGYDRSCSGGIKGIARSGEFSYRCNAWRALSLSQKKE